MLLEIYPQKGVDPKITKYMLETSIGGYRNKVW